MALQDLSQRALHVALSVAEYSVNQFFPKAGAHAAGTGGEDTQKPPDEEVPSNNREVDQRAPLQRRGAGERVPRAGDRVGGSGNDRGRDA